MKRSLTVLLLIMIIHLSACHQVKYTEAWFNETCQEKGYDYAMPVYMDDEIAGFNCCVEVGERTYDCEDFYYLDELTNI